MLRLNFSRQKLTVSVINVDKLKSLSKKNFDKFVDEVSITTLIFIINSHVRVLV